MQCLRRFGRIFIIFNPDPRQLFSLGFIRGNNIHQRQQFVRKFTCRGRVKGYRGLILMCNLCRSQYAFDRRL